MKTSQTSIRKIKLRISVDTRYYHCRQTLQTGLAQVLVREKDQIIYACIYVSIL